MNNVMKCRSRLVTAAVLYRHSSLDTVSSSHKQSQWTKIIKKLRTISHSGKKNKILRNPEAIGQQKRVHMIIYIRPKINTSLTEPQDNTGASSVDESLAPEYLRQESARDHGLTTVGNLLQLTRLILSTFWTASESVKSTTDITPS